MDTQSPSQPAEQIADQDAVSATPMAIQLPDWVLAAEDRGTVVPTATDGCQSVLTIQETAKLLRVSTRTVRRLVARKEITVVRIGRSLRITRDALARFMRDEDGYSFNDL